MLTIRDLHAQTPEGKVILQGIHLHVRPGEVHAIMGPNGSGKSTLSNVLAGRPDFVITQGDVTFLGENLLEMAPQVRAAKGLFLAFQYPVEIPGVNNMYFLKTALNSIRRYQGQSELDAFEFIQLIEQHVQALGMDKSFLERAVNEGFSGGEKKRNEILQMRLLNPRLAILDETDSGLDIDALQVVAKGVTSLRNKDNAFVVVTHYQRLLEYIEPDFVHVLANGKIVKSGGKELAHELEQKGYGWLSEECC